MTLTEELLNWSRRQRTNAFKAALDAEYPGRVVAGTMARLEPVLSLFGIVRTSSWNMECGLTISHSSRSSCSSRRAGTYCQVHEGREVGGDLRVEVG